MTCDSKIIGNRYNLIAPHGDDSAVAHNSMENNLFNSVYNPDVLSCIANLSNDEVFTPPELANRIIDMLPQELFENPDTTFLDPCCKSGVFLREIAKRLIKGLERQMPDLEKRLEHIFSKQLYGIAITELTSLLARRSVYCSKFPSSPWSAYQFHEDKPQGNIIYQRIQHTWQNGKCIHCGASQSEYDRDQELETYAYQFIHNLDVKKLFDMKFDVIIGNPPYQLSDGGGTGSSAMPLYHKFVEQAKKLSPRYLTMIIPARWYSGGKGLDTFRSTMLTDKSIRVLVDYDNFKDAFPGVDVAGGVCYFLWDRDNKGICRVTNFRGNETSSTVERFLDEYDTFIRTNQAIQIVKKVGNHHKNRKFLNERISVRLPFGIPTTYPPKATGIPCYFTQRIGVKFVSKEDVSDNLNILYKWKFLIPKAPIAGQTDFSKPVAFYYDGNTRIAKPNECCSESWLVAGVFETEAEAINFKSYILTKTVRFLLLQTVVSQNITRKNFCFVPDLGTYEERYTDDKLRKMWNISMDEWNLIESKIGEIGINSND